MGVSGLQKKNYLKIQNNSLYLQRTTLDNSHSINKHACYTWVTKKEDHTKGRCNLLLVLEFCPTVEIEYLRKDSNHYTSHEVEKD